MTTTKIGLHKVKRKGNRQVWMLRWYGTDSKRYGETIGDCKKMTKREAMALLREKQGGMDHGKTQRNKPRKLTLIEFKQYHRDMAGTEIKEKTHTKYDCAIDHAIKTLGPNKQLENITMEDAVRLRARLKQDVHCKSTVDSIIRVLRAAFNRAKLNKLVSENPFAGMKTPPADAKEGRIFSDDEIATLIATASSLWWKAIIKLVFSTGMRVGEIENLRWKNVDLDGAEVHVRQRQAGTFSIDGVEYPILEWSAKTKKGYRTIPIPTSTVTMLRMLKKESDGSEYLFLTLERLALIHTRKKAGKWSIHSRVIGGTYLHCFKNIQKQALGKDAKIGTFHDARRTFATHCAAVVPMHVLQEIMGHEDIATTAKYYTRMQESDAAIIRKATEGKPALKLAV